MGEHAVSIIIAVITSTAVSAVIVKLLERDKQKAEVKSVGVHDDINIGELGLKYAREFKDEIDKLKKKNEELEAENTRLDGLISDMQNKIDALVNENASLKLEIKRIRGRV